MNSPYPETSSGDGVSQPGSAPRFDTDFLQQEYDREREDASKFIRISAWVILTVSVLMSAGLIMAGHYHPGRMLANALLMGASLGGLLLLRLGRTLTAFNTFVVGNWVAIAVLVWFTGGYSSILTGGWILLIGYAAWLHTASWLAGLGIATVLAIAAMAIAEQQHWLPQAAPTTTLARAGSLAVLFGLGAALFTSFSVAVRKRLTEIATSRDEIASSALAREASQRQLQLVADNVPAMLMHVDINARFLWFNQRYADFYGVDLSQLIGKSLLEVIGLENAQATSDLIDRVVASRAGITVEYIRSGKDRRSRVMRSELVPEIGPDGEVKGIFNLIQDITETRRRADLMAALATSIAGATESTLFCQLVESLAKVLSVRYALVTELVDGGKTAHALGFWGDGALLPEMTYDLGGTPCKIAVETGICFVKQDVAQRFSEDRALAIKGIESYFGIALIGRDGSPIGVLTIMDVRAMEEDPEREAAMRVFASRAAAELERMRASEALARSEETFASIFHESPLIMLTTGPDGIDRVNPAFEKILGYPRNSLIGRRVMDVGFISVEAQNRLGPILVSGADVNAVEVSMTAASGRIVQMQVSGRIRRIGGQERQLWYGQEITEIRAAQRELEQLNTTLEQRVMDRTRELASALESLQLAQAQLVQVEKQASLGRMVAGLAHELNTPIGNGLLTASALSARAGEFTASLGRPLRRADLDSFVSLVATGSDLVERNLKRMAELVTHFKQLAVDQATSNRREFDLNEVATEAELMVRSNLGSVPCRIDWLVAPGLNMHSYPGPLCQVLRNLVSNAAVHGFAGRESGLIQVCAGALNTDSVWIEVKDDGIGIAAENLKRIFDPFFTTRMGSSTGLGLNFVHNIVTGLLGGSISVNSQPGSGASFRLTLPRRAPTVTEMVQAQAHSGPS